MLNTISTAKLKSSKQKPTNSTLQENCYYNNFLDYNKIKNGNKYPSQPNK